MDFGKAINEMKQGKRVARAGWNGKDMYIYIVKGTEVQAINLRNEALEFVGRDQQSPHDLVKINSHIDMKAADGSIVVGWLASQTDILAEDWKVVDK